MSSNASQKVTFRIAKRHLLPDCSFPPAESGADTALRGGSLRPPRGRKTIYTPSSPPPPTSRSHHAAAPRPAHNAGPSPAAGARMPARHHAPLPCAEGAGAPQGHAPAGARRGRAARGKAQAGRPPTHRRAAGDAETPSGRSKKGGRETQKKEQRPSRPLLLSINYKHFFCYVGTIGFEPMTSAM